MDTININNLPPSFQKSIKQFIKANPNCGLTYPTTSNPLMSFRDALDCFLRWNGMRWYSSSQLSVDVIITFIMAMNAEEAAPLEDEHKLVETMRNNGGHFASRLAMAWQHADGSNVRKLRREFNDLLETFRQHIPLYIERATPPTSILKEFQIEGHGEPVTLKVLQDMTSDTGLLTWAEYANTGTRFQAWYWTKEKRYTTVTRVK